MPESNRHLRDPSFTLCSPAGAQGIRKLGGIENRSGKGGRKGGKNRGGGSFLTWPFYFGRVRSLKCDASMTQVISARTVTISNITFLLWE